ncbi:MULTISPECIES: hypothetical protein [unclassified Synechococcus]|uniref:hypothetical protein n=1 Tax=unclassified Synechococcus TaxID=2626047 RepID=UPI0021A40754|nr:MULTISPECIES: hypothetical protein [unclassified Synechococcus]MCT0212441.1 hypothetical protein [Synechococcus sp. CS-1326]MCT0234624.1 hypothetical protein [Synechococcus sp. CS-1327]
MAPLILRSLHGQVHRFTGVVDRFGGFLHAGEVVHTVCIRELQHARTEQPVQPDHWWFRLRAPWAEAGMSQGDTVLFTAKVQHCSKGWDADSIEPDGPVRRRHQVIGLGGRIRDVVVTHRAQRHSVLIDQLEERLRHQAQQLVEAEDRARLLEQHRDALLGDLAGLQKRLQQATIRCRVLDPKSAKALQVPLRCSAGGGQRRGFASLSA